MKIVNIAVVAVSLLAASLALMGCGRANQPSEKKKASASDEIKLEGKLVVTMQYEGALSFGAGVPQLATSQGTYTLRTSSTDTKWVNMKMNGPSVIYNLGSIHQVRGRLAEDDKTHIWVSYIEDLGRKE